LKRTAPAGSDPRHYGLTWAGDKVTELEALRDAEPAKLDVTISQEIIDATINADSDIVYDDVTDATYVVLLVDVLDYSTYAFSFDVPEPVYAETDTVVPVTFANRHRRTGDIRDRRRRNTGLRQRPLRI